VESELRIEIEPAIAKLRRSSVKKSDRDESPSERRQLFKEGPGYASRVCGTGGFSDQRQRSDHRAASIGLHRRKLYPGGSRRLDPQLRLSQAAARSPASERKKTIMKVGLFINTQFPEGFNLAERVPEMVAQVRAAREAGFASL
jgi:hypothetical protein